MTALAWFTCPGRIRWRITVPWRSRPLSSNRQGPVCRTISRMAARAAWGIVRGGGVAPRRLWVQVLEIREVDGQPGPPGPSGSPPGRSPRSSTPPSTGRGLLQYLAHHMGVVGGVDKVDVMGPLGDELQADLPQALHRNRPAEVLMADLLILTEHTPQGAAGRRRWSPDPRRREMGGSSHMWRAARAANRRGGHAAIALAPPYLCADGIASPGTEIAEHRGSPPCF